MNEVFFYLFWVCVFCFCRVFFYFQVGDGGFVGFAGFEKLGLGFFFSGLGDRRRLLVSTFQVLFVFVFLQESKDFVERREMGLFLVLSGKGECFFFVQKRGVCVGSFRSYVECKVGVGQVRVFRFGVYFFLGLLVNSVLLGYRCFSIVCEEVFVGFEWSIILIKINSSR